MTLQVLNNLTKGHLQPELLAQIGEEVAAVEHELSEQMRSQVELVQKIGLHTLKAGGKRLRPAFVTLAAKATDLKFDVERTRRLGACMEMIHMATLIHDDVIDNSASRRGRSTASAEFGSTASILSGDVLLAKAMLLLARDGDLGVIRCVSEAVVDMAEGEVREVEVRGDFDLEEAAHMEVLRLKTASFIEACCEIGGILAGASQATTQALRIYGYHVGMAFQIIDDVLDYRGDKAKTGKPTATDFREGQATLPLIALRARLDEAEIQLVRRRFGGTVNDDEVRMIVGWMETRGAFTEAEQRSAYHVERALEAVANLPETASRQLLETVANYVVQREK